MKVHIKSGFTMAKVANPSSYRVALSLDLPEFESHLGTMSDCPCGGCCSAKLHRVYKETLRKCRAVLNSQFYE